MPKLFVFILLLSSFHSYASTFAKDCREVGQYIYEHSNEVFNNLYVKYNAPGPQKAKVYQSEYNYRARKTNHASEYYPDKRFEYFTSKFEETFQYFLNYSEQLELNFDQTLDKTKNFDYKKQEKLFYHFFAKSYCRKLKVNNSRLCKRNMRKIFNHMQVQSLSPPNSTSTAALSLPEKIKSTLTNPDQLLLVYKTVEKLMPNAINESMDYPGNIKTVLDEKARELFTDASQQEEMVWDILGAYASRGASYDSFGRILTSPNNAYSYSTHFELYNLMHAFDSHRTADNYFSLPKFNQNSCEFGKAYHFWMAAYLSRYLMKHKNQNPIDAFNAAAAVGVMYDFFGSGSNQRARTRLFTEDLESIYTKSIQQSVLFKILGAFYGVAPREFASLNVDELYQSIKNNMYKRGGRIYTSQAFHFYNLKKFLAITQIDEIISTLNQQF